MKFVLSFLPLCLLLNACPASSFVPGITSPFKYNIRSPTRSSAKGGLYDIYAPLRSTTEGTDIGSKRKSRKAAKAAKSALYEGSKYPDQDPVEEELQRESVAKRRDGDVDGVSDDNSPPPQSVDEDIGDIKSIVEGREGEVRGMEERSDGRGDRREGRWTGEGKRLSYTTTAQYLHHPTCRFALRRFRK